MGLTVGRCELEAILDCLLATVEGGGTKPVLATPGKQSVGLLLKAYLLQTFADQVERGEGRRKHSPPSKAELEHRSVLLEDLADNCKISPAEHCSCWQKGLP